MQCLPIIPFLNSNELSVLHTQEDLPSICEHLIQINPVSLVQEHSALVYHVGLHREQIPIFHIAGVPDFQIFYLDAQKNLIT